MNEYDCIFVLGYDLLHDFCNNKELTCDEAFSLCKSVYEDFLKSEYDDYTKSEYECLQKFIIENHEYLENKMEGI